MRLCVVRVMRRYIGAAAVAAGAAAAEAAHSELSAVPTPRPPSAPLDCPPLLHNTR